jgi:hypothetical protein
MTLVFTEGMAALRRAAEQGIFRGAIATQRRRLEAQRWHDRRLAYTAAVKAVLPDSPLGRRAAHLAAMAAWRSAAWTALAAGEAEMARESRAMAVPHAIAALAEPRA